MKVSIGEFLAALRRAHGYTQQEVADRLGVSNRTVSAWERGTVMPDILLLPALAELYGVTTDEILAGERRAGEARPVLSERSERKLLKRRLGSYTVQSLILLGVLATGLLLFFIGWYVNVVTVAWTGWRWWLLLLFLGLAAALIALVCLAALWKGAENAADEETDGYGAFCILLRKRLAFCLYLAAALCLVFAAVSLINWFGNVFWEAFLVMAAAFALLALGLFLFGFFSVDAAQRKWGGEQAAENRAKNVKLYKRCAVFALIPVVIGLGGIVLFAYWGPETRVPIYEEETARFTEELESLEVGRFLSEEEGAQELPQAGTFRFPLSELSLTAKEGTSYDLGNGFSCTFTENSDVCTISSRYSFTTKNRGWQSGIVARRLHARTGDFAVYNLKYANREEWAYAVSGTGQQPLRLELETDGGNAKLLGCFRENDFVPAAFAFSCEMLFGLAACFLVCARKRAKLTVKLK